MRLFVGIPLADAVARELANVTARLREGESARSGSRLRWTAPESWHVTLQFLGNATEEQFTCLRAHLGEVRAEPVAVKLGELGCFDRAGVIFADVTVTPELAALERIRRVGDGAVWIRSRDPAVSSAHHPGARQRTRAGNGTPRSAKQSSQPACIHALHGPGVCAL